MGGTASNTCDQVQSCLDLAITEGNGFTDIGCWGYKSCQNAYISVPYIECSAAYSCFSAQLIAATTDDNILCFGANSCQNSDMIQVALSLDCGGINSCSNTTMTRNKNSTLTPDSFSSVYCSADRSCDNTSIMSASGMKIYGYGAHSLENAIIDVTSADNNYPFVNETLLWLGGYYAGIVFITFSTINFV